MSGVRASPIHLDIADSGSTTAHVPPTSPSGMLVCDLHQRSSSYMLSRSTVNRGAVTRVACHCPRIMLESLRLTPPATAWAEGAQLNGRPSSPTLEESGPVAM